MTKFILLFLLLSFLWLVFRVVLTLAGLRRRIDERVREEREKYTTSRSGPSRGAESGEGSFRPGATSGREKDITDRVTVLEENRSDETR